MVAFGLKDSKRFVHVLLSKEPQGKKDFVGFMMLAHKVPAIDSSLNFGETTMS